jgi:hypothetical protein
VKRLAAILVLALSLLGCQSEKVHLAVNSTDAPGCILIGATGTLIVDPKYGTALDTGNASVGDHDVNPIIWPAGFSARRVGSEVEVLDATGKVVATTGRRYEIGFENTGFGARPRMELVACGNARPL